MRQTLNDLPERVRAEAIALGGTAYGTARTAAKRSRLDEYPLEISAGTEHVAALGDADTADLFTGVSRGIDKLLWKVEAHHQ